MTKILAPTTDIRSRGIGVHILYFTDGVADDPGLDAGHRAYLEGCGYRFTDAPADVPGVEDVPAPDPEPVVEPVAEEPAKPKRTRRKPATQTADAA